MNLLLVPLPPPCLSSSALFQFSTDTVQVPLLWTVAVQCTVPSGLQEMVTAVTDRLHTEQVVPPGVGVSVGVLVTVLVGVSVAVLVTVGVLVGVLVLVGVWVGGVGVLVWVVVGVVGVLVGVFVGVLVGAAAV